MSGFVQASVHLDWQGKYWDVIPDRCPLLERKAADGSEEPQHGHKPPCYRQVFPNERRACPYWIAVVRPANACHRVDPGTLLQDRGGGEYVRASAPCGVLCQAQRRNRPPGAV